MTTVVEESFGKNPIINDSLEGNASSEISIEADSKQEIPGDDKKAIQKRSFWNLFVFSISYLLLFTGFWTLSTLQSTMNALEGIGDYSQAVIYVCSTVSCILLPTFMIGKFGCKNILLFGAVTCVLCMASNMFLRWDTLMVGAVLYGVANGPFIASQAFYIDEMATRFLTTVEGQSEFIMALFFGLFMFFGQSTQIWGNLISYYVLRSDRPAPSPLNSTDCGINFRPSVNDTNRNLDPPTENQRFLLVGIYVGMGCVAIFVLGIFLEPLRNDLQETKGCRTILDRLLSSFKFLRDPVRILLIPLSVYIGMEGPFYTNEVTQVS
ncbi:hypothetical protein JTE90_013428 [Oedothorax gibbosus]|uniref:Uncharacterized protein n=1 Tax=Oedothorax gibbosus TaxID=931172 RepID=A0AAV6UGU6_9ARAC|nr:hypothetical protein JTE90_013428 [Oedothorax gibbosus]